MAPLSKITAHFLFFETAFIVRSALRDKVASILVFYVGWRYAEVNFLPDVIEA